MKNEIAIKCFDVVPFMKQKQRRTKRKERDKKKEPKESKKDKKEEKKTARERERETEREIEKGGGQKRLRRNKGRDSKIIKKCPFLREKQFLY